VDGKYISTYFITMVGCQTWIQCQSVFCPYIIHPAQHTCECCFGLAISKLNISSLPYKLPQYDRSLGPSPSLASSPSWMSPLLTNPRIVWIWTFENPDSVFNKEVLTSCRNNPKNNLSFLWLCQCGCWLGSRIVRYQESKIPYMIPIFTLK
jgi:hypothetical protein